MEIIPDEPYMKSLEGGRGRFDTEGRWQCDDGSRKGLEDAMIWL